MAIAISNSVTIPVINSGNGTLEDEFINGLVQGSSWVFSGSRILTYSFNRNDDGSYPEGPAVPGPGGDWSSYPQIATAVTQALNAWAAVANISFQEIASGDYYFQSSADLAFTLTGNDLQFGFGAAALGFFPDPAYVNATLTEGGYSAETFPNMEGNVFLDNYGTPIASDISAGSPGFWTVLHEIGHALGLKHPFDDGGNLRPEFAALGIGAYDAMQYTAMAYGSLGSAHAATPMPLDILAIQFIYGANTSYNTGDNSYALNNGFYGTIWDAGGIDSVIGSLNGWDGVWIDLNPGAHSGQLSGTKLTAIAYGAIIENAYGTYGHDRLIGNSIANILDGAGSNDTIDGGAGADTMIGGWGDDLFFVEDAGDLIIENSGNEGIDSVESAVGTQLPANVENLRLTGSGAADIAGNALRNTLIGNAAANRVDGGGGIDRMIGGAGDDVYHVDALQAPHAFNFSGPTGEWVSGGQTHAYSGATGNFMVVLADSPSDEDNIVDFLSINYTDVSHNWWVSFGTDNLGLNLVPGTYLDAQRTTFATSGHAAFELSGDGRGSNTIYASFTINSIQVDYSGAQPVLLAFNANFEQRSESLAASALTGSINYDVLNLSIESVVELVNEGRDSIRSTVSAVLPNHVENLVLEGFSDLAGSGNSFGNILSGNSGHNVLDGAAGADIIAGGAGNDNYVIDNSDDQVMELGGSGTDLIQSAVNYNLMQSWHVENLTLTGGSAINGFGNWLDNIITGNAAANRLEGDRGNDTISGGGGSDTLLGGFGDDMLVWSAGAASVHGGEGFDTLLIEGSGMTLDLTLIANSVISDFEYIDITGSGNNTLTLALGDVLALTPNTLRIFGNGGDVVNGGSGWTPGGSVSLADGLFNVYSQSTAVVLVDADIAQNFV